MAILGFAQAGEGVLFRVVDLASRGIDLVETEVTRGPALPVVDGTVKHDGAAKEAGVCSDRT
jgi:hypothetical protein